MMYLDECLQVASSFSQNPQHRCNCWHELKSSFFFTTCTANPASRWYAHSAHGIDTSAKDRKTQSRNSYWMMCNSASYPRHLTNFSSAAEMSTLIITFLVFYQVRECCYRKGLFSSLPVQGRFSLFLEY